jgi:hypothetical protein
MSEAEGGGPHERLVGRLRELADAVTQGRDAVAREFTMRVPAEPERDADLVLSKAADELDRLRAEVERQRNAKQAALTEGDALAAQNAALRAEVEALRDRLDTVEVQGSRTVVQGWVCIPEVEWDAVMTPNAVLTGLRPGVVGLNEACPRRSS